MASCWWYPYGKGNLATIQLQLGHLLGGGRDPIQGPQAADDQGTGSEYSPEDGEQRQQRRHAHQLDDRFIDFLHRYADHEREVDLTGNDREADHAIVTESAEGDGALGAIGRYVSELGDCGVGYLSNVCAVLSGGAGLGQHAACLGCAVAGVEHSKRADRLARAQQTTVRAATGPGARRIAYPSSDGVELAVELGDQQLPDSQGCRCCDQQGS